jgi:hypothetical protein
MYLNSVSSSKDSHPGCIEIDLVGELRLRKPTVVADSDFMPTLMQYLRTSEPRTGTLDSDSMSALEPYSRDV